MIFLENEFTSIYRCSIKQGVKVGTVDLLYQGNVVGSVDMVTTEEVTEGFNLLGFLHKLFFS